MDARRDADGASNGQEGQQAPAPEAAGAFTVHEFLRREKEAIVRAWEARVVADAHEAELSRLALRDDIPGLLDELADWLQSGAPPQDPRLTTKALSHSMQRLDHGLSLEQVFCEYRVLREILIHAVLTSPSVARDLAGASGETCRRARIDELARLNAALDVVQSRSLVEFIAERERRAKADHATAAQAVCESEARYRSLFESMDEGFCIIELLFEGEQPVDYRFLQVNPAFERHTGLGNATGKRIREMVPGHEKYWLEIFGEVARTGEPIRFENPDQSLGPFSDIYALRIGAPEQHRLAVLFNDISRRKHAEDSLRASEELKAFLLKLSDALRPLSEAEAVSAMVTRTARDYFGADRCFYCAIEGPSVVIRGDAARADLPSVAGDYSLASLPVFKAVLRIGRPVVVEDVRTTTLLDESLRNLCIERQILSFLDVPLIQDGEPVGILCLTQCRPRKWTSIEIRLAVETAERAWAAVERARAEEALRASEAKYKNLFETIEEMVTVYDIERDTRGSIVECRVREANPAFLRAVGASAVDEIRGRTCTELLGKAWTVQQIDAIEEAMTSGQEQVQEVFRPESGRHYVTSIVRLDAGSFLTTGWDISERKRTEEDLKRANLQLAEADRRKNEFLAVLSHELRNPLAPVANSLYILDHAPPGGQQAERAKRVIGRQVAQLSNLVNDLLDVTRITRNKIQLHKEPLELHEAVSRAVEDHRSLFARAGIHVELAAESRPIPLMADRVRLTQIIGNLLHNSAKFTGRGGHTRVSVSAQGGEAVVRVADDGIGMSRETLAGLFQPFVQAEQSIDRSKGGLGLGLALVKGLAELHGGSVSAHSEGLGHGTEMIVRLPMDTSGTASAVTAPAPAGGGERRVLIIEDNPDAANSLREALALGQHAVEVAYSGSEALAKAHAFHPDVVLCDIGLPGMSGYDVARAFRADDELKHVFLVALSGYGLPADLELATQAGFQRHVTKPPDVEKLSELLRTLPPGNAGT